MFNATPGSLFRLRQFLHQDHLSSQRVLDIFTYQIETIFFRKGEEE
jgi:hypothetical protein